MTRLVAATISLVWAAAFGGLSAVCLLAADRGPAAASLAFRLPAALDLGALAGRPVFAGLCFGAAIVAALFATVAVSCALNGRQHLAQGAFLADMAVGGAACLTALIGGALVLNADAPQIASLVLVAVALAASFRTLRWALKPPAPEPVAPAAVRRMAADAAANTNVVAFPLKAPNAAGGTR
jgi:hypothetical protein